MEATIYIGYVPSANLLKALQPLVTLLEEVEKERTHADAKYVSHFDEDS